MVDFGNVLGSITGQAGQTFWTFAFIIIGIVVGLLLLGIAAWWWFFKKKWNLKAEIKLPRSDGKLTSAEWGKAYFNAKRGVCFVKRPGILQRPTPVPLFDLRKYVQGTNIVTFIQLSPEDYLPVLNTSWEEYIEDTPMTDSKGRTAKYPDGSLVYEKAALMDIKIDTGKNKAWKVAWAQAAKQAYSLKSFFTQFQTPIAIAIVIIAVFVGFAMMWTRLGNICG